jgi:CBS domain-containing protein
MLDFAEGRLPHCATVTPKNVIPDRIATALRRFPPFSMMSAESVQLLASDASVRAIAAGDFVWKQGDQPAPEVLFLARGRVEYIWEVENRRERVDIRDVGDVLGFTALLQAEPQHSVSAQAVEDCLLYGLPAARIRSLLEANDEARRYVRRHSYWVARVGRSVALAEPADSEFAGRAKNILQAHLDGAQLVQPRSLDRLLTCAPDAPISEAATLMASKHVPSILVVDPARRPLGIVTANALVKRVIVDDIERSAPVSRVMAQPVVTVSPRSSATAAILLMLRERIGQVCVTEDGTPETPALDVCTQKDLLAQSGHHPAGLLREIRLAKSNARFRELCDEVEAIARSYLEAGVSAIYLGQICAELYDELVQRLIELSATELHEQGIALPATSWAWMSVGSDGRREQILRTDMDNAVVFESLGSAAADDEAREVFLQLATRVIDRMAAAGFARCQGGVMALNPKWCRTVREYATEFATLDADTGDDRLLRVTVLFDLRYVAGSRSLCEDLRKIAFDSAVGSAELQRLLAQQVVATAPPLNFIGRFVMEKLGVGEEVFDLKARGMAPLRDAARILCLRHRLHRRYSTGGRWDEIRRALPRFAEIATSARDAYDFLLRVRTLNGLQRGDSGRFINSGELTKLERGQLASIFDVVRMVQDSVRLEFELNVRPRD